jgi:Tol biopolymer transport system component
MHDLAFALTALTSHSGPAPVEVEASRPKRSNSRLAWGVAAALAVAFLLASAVASVLYLQRPSLDSAPVHFSIAPPEGWTLSATGIPFAVSPDGRRIVVAAVHRDGRQLLLLRSLDTLIAAPLNGTDGAVLPFWSPDSRFVGFFAAGKLKRVDIRGGPPAIVCDSVAGAGASWNQNDVILFSAGTGPGTVVQAVPAAGGVPRPASTLKPGEMFHSGPWFLPDGRHFIYAAAQEGGGSVNYVAALDSDDSPIELPTDAPKVVYVNGHLVFTRERALIAQSFDVERLQPVGEPFRVVDEVQFSGGIGVPLITGTRRGGIAYGLPVEGNEARAVWFDRDGKELAALADTAGAVDVRVAPNGEAIAITRASPDGADDIWLLDAARGAPIRVTASADDERSPVWAPDSKSLAYLVARNGRPRSVLQSVDGSGGPVRQLLDAQIESAPMSWSRDGRFLLYATIVTQPGAPRGPADLWVLPMNGDQKSMPFLTTRFLETAGMFSPDGRWVAYQGNDSGTMEVYVAPFPGPGPRTRISRDGGNGPRWSPDGRKLYYVGGAASGPLTIIETAVDGSGGRFVVGASRELPIRMPRTAIPPYRRYDVAPDGRLIALTVPLSQTREGQRDVIGVILDWAPAQ